jgi:hypothetical protein
MTISEAALWRGISRRQTGARFRRQVPIGEWIADFACFDPKLVIEVDGESHDWRMTADRLHRSAGFSDPAIQERGSGLEFRWRRRGDGPLRRRCGRT